MEIKQKGGTAALEETFKQLRVDMTWNSKADFDLAAIFEKKDGSKGMVYFGELGDLNEAPFIKLSGDAGIGDTVDDGGNKEIMKINKLDAIAKLHIIVWDYGAVQAGTPARFAGSDVKVAVVDDKNTSNEVTLDAGDMGNVLVLATIDNTSAMGPQLVNKSLVGTLKGLEGSEQLWAIVDQAA